ncbi:MAG: sensor histidine kinase [Planctomycetaceae bacterium]|nr:sensor histidine kinase [Planctomycetaceae bacterium]
MPHRLKRLAEEANPWQRFVSMLVIIFVVEMVLMLVLPYIVSMNNYSRLPAAIADASLLTVLLSPILWLIAVKPLQELTETRRMLLAKLLEAQEDERGRIARDLHDGIGQSLTSLLVGLRVAEEKAENPMIVEQIRNLRKIGSVALEEIRTMARGLRPVVLDDVGLSAALERLAGEYTSLHGIQVEFDSVGFESHRLPRRNETTIYRIAQEAITNAIRHGAASRILVIIKLTATAVSVEVRDDGRGFNPDTVRGAKLGRESFGLLSMEERARMSDGDLTIVSSPGSGTSIKAEIPIRKGGKS